VRASYSRVQRMEIESVLKKVMGSEMRPVGLDGSSSLKGDGNGWKIPNFNLSFRLYDLRFSRR
jgi:hypothetical protein